MKACGAESDMFTLGHAGSKAGSWLFAAAALTLTWTAHAAGDAKLGEKKFYTCVGCHGIDNYKNAYPDYSVPKLRHQNALYIVAALQEYKSGARPHATMHAQASSLSDQDMEDIAAYLQGLDPVKPPAPTPATTAALPSQVASCAACHGDVGLGVDAPMEPKPPILAGQYSDYLTQALIAYRNGRRKNAVMNGMAASLTTDRDVAVAAAYFSGQPTPLATAKVGSQ
jgi:cytochrome c553